MDLSQAVTIELPGQAALDLNSVRDPNAVGSAPVSGYNIESVDFSDVGVTAFSEDTPQVDGIDSYDAYLGARQIAMIIGVYGNSYGDFWDKITELNYALQPRPTFATGQAFPDDGFRKLSFTQLKAAGSYSLYMKVRPMALPRFVTEAGASPTVAWSNTSTFSPLRVELGSDSVAFTKAGGFGSNFSVDFKTCVSTQTNYLTEYEFFAIPPGTSTVTVTSGAGVTCTITINEALL